MDAIASLNALTQKSDKGKSKAPEGAKLLLVLCQTSAEDQKVAEYLCLLHYSVALIFFEQATAVLPEEKIQSIRSAFQRNPKYKSKSKYFESQTTNQTNTKQEKVPPALTELQRVTATLAGEIESIFKNAQQANTELKTLLQTVAHAEKPDVQPLGRDEELTQLRLQLAERDSKIADLEQRLTVTLKLNTSAHNQQLITIKTDIANALKLEYQDYQESKAKEFSASQYEAYHASLFRIFKALKRFGIPFA
jgi:hypothetical protein